ncbi:hypothetical protein BN1708_020465, partial [Verticillium longisporum]
LAWRALRCRREGRPVSHPRRNRHHEEAEPPKPRSVDRGA